MSVDRVDEVSEAQSGDATEAVAMAAEAVRYYPVAPGVRLNVRSGPGTNYPVTRILSEGVKVPIYCQSPGTTVTGPYGTSNIWDNIANGEFVSDAYVKTGSDGYVRPRCSL
ncbi:SH3 domain-containing protein [Streptomyces cinnabarinus]|uniref:SH3 domain-containing protein n=1 Tax=Streptomyces cinnabarinus TaxID=67287 RepID=A0ABY7KHY4_9ACTN|nr:SH3 domain-containing protein [Streptomyces cinnabarinus]WAZ23260.1 SH3 domain-containing protein [Streptomyces cinnabarinus]